MVDRSILNLKLAFYNLYKTFQHWEFEEYTKIYRSNFKNSFFYLFYSIFPLSTVLYSIFIYIIFDNYGFFFGIITFLIFFSSFIFIFKNKITSTYLNNLSKKLIKFMYAKILGKSDIQFCDEGILIDKLFYEWSFLEFNDNFYNINIQGVKDKLRQNFTPTFHIEYVTKPKTIEFNYKGQIITLENLGKVNYMKVLKGILYFYFFKFKRTCFI